MPCHGEGDGCHSNNLPTCQVVTSHSTMLASCPPYNQRAILGTASHLWVPGPRSYPWHCLGGLSRFPTTLYLAAHRITCPAVHLLVQTFKTAFLTPKKTKGAGKMKGSPVWTERHYQNPCLHPSHSPYYPRGNISTPVPCHLSSCEDEERLERERERGKGVGC